MACMRVLNALDQFPWIKNERQLTLLARAPASVWRHCNAANADLFTDEPFGFVFRCATIQPSRTSPPLTISSYRHFRNCL